MRVVDEGVEESTSDKEELGPAEELTLEEVESASRVHFTPCRFSPPLPRPLSKK